MYPRQTELPQSLPMLCPLCDVCQHMQLLKCSVSALPQDDNGLQYKQQ